MQRRNRFIVCFSVFLVLISSTVYSVEPNVKVEVNLKSYYTSNLYHVTKKQEDQFDSKDGTDERFHGMESPDDFVVRPGAGVTWKWDIAKKRDCKISLGVEQYLHAQNTIADYLRIQAGTAYDLTRNDNINLAIELIPDRFRKNLSMEDPDTGLKIFRRADYRQISFEPRYLHDWNNDWRTGIEYEYSKRDFEGPFADRDRKRHTLMALVGYDGFERMDVTFGTGYSTTRISKNTEFGVEVDRSYDDIITELDLDFNLPHKWKAEFNAKYRRRDYMSNEPADDGHYNRADDLWAIRAEVGKWIRKDFLLALDAGWARNDSNRNDPTIEADDVGYEEYTVGINAEWRF